jgi:glycosyltransferase involved in cell wall biosynthesis
VIPNPVATVRADRKSRTVEQLGRYPQLVGKKVILFLSRLDPKKGLDLLLEGFAKARAPLPDAVLVVAGDGDQCFVARLQEQAHRLGIERDVFWAGFVEGKEKEALFAIADVFVLPSYSENFGIAVVEALARGVPVLVSDQVGIHYDVARAEAGLVVPCKAVEVQKALIQILSNRTLLDDMARNAQLLAEQYSPATVSARLLAEYEVFARDSSLRSSGPFLTAC